MAPRPVEQYLGGEGVVLRMQGRQLTREVVEVDAGRNSRQGNTNHLDPLVRRRVLPPRHGFHGRPRRSPRRSSTSVRQAPTTGGLAARVWATRAPSVDSR